MSGMPPRVVIWITSTKTVLREATSMHESGVGPAQNKRVPEFGFMRDFVPDHRVIQQRSNKTLIGYSIRSEKKISSSRRSPNRNVIARKNSNLKFKCCQEFILHSLYSDKVLGQTGMPNDNFIIAKYRAL